MTNIGAIWEFFTSTLIGSDISHVFCQLITVVFVLSSVWLIYLYRHRAFSPSQLLYKLEELSASPKASGIVTLLNDTKERWHVLRNFTESLIEVPEDDGSISHQRTQPSSNQINPEVVNPRLFKGYFLVWIPSVLTTLGVLGTFVGLQIGLGGINLEGSVEEMLAGIGVLIEGAKTAFNTSIFGVSAGILFGFSLRAARQRQRNLLQSIANHLDAQIPEASPEDDLRLVRVSAAQTTEQLKALREEVGPKLQETLHGMPTLIGSAVAKGIEGAVGAIGKQNAESLGDALKQVYSDHLGDLAGLGETIRNQVEVTKLILDKLELLAPALQTSSSHLDSSSKSLESVSTQFGSWDEKLEAYSVNLLNSTKSFDSASTTLDAASKLIESSIPNLQNAIGSANKASEANQTAISDNSKSLITSFDSVTKSFKGFGDAVTSMKNLAPSLATTASTLQGFVDSIETTSAAQEENSKNNKAAAEQFGQVAVHFESAAKHLGTLGEASANLKEAGDAAKDGSLKLQAVTVQLESLVSSLKSIAASFDLVRDEELGEQFTSATEALNEASTKLVHLTNASENFEKAGTAATRLFTEAGAEHTTFVEGLTSGVASLKEEIASLLETYRHSMAEQTQQRIQDWNTEATNFGVHFKQKVDDLSGSIEDLQESLATLNPNR
jgi:ABC-type transporter Mla subunit MlaD